MPNSERRDILSSPAAWVQSACLLGLGFAVALAAFRYKLAKSPLVPKLDKDGKLAEDPARLATRALAWGTLFSVLGTGSIGAMVLYGFSAYKQSEPKALIFTTSEKQGYIRI